jgi:hypothetical protein
MGCDPEFFLVDNITNNIISASHFFPHYGQVGSDAGLAELRPRPSMDVDELTNNMKQLILQASDSIKSRIIYRNRPINMMAESMHKDSSAGFHIHFGLPPMLLKNNRQTLILIYKMVYTLDYYVGISSIIPEGNDDFRRRSAGYGLYGKPADFRSDGNTLEYRVPGGHLLRHPVLTRGLFAISKVVMKDMLSRIGKFTDNFQNFECLKRYDVLKELYPSMPDRNIVYAAITSENINMALKHLVAIYTDITKMIGFKENEPAIRQYFNYIFDYYKEGKKYTANMEHNWRN